MRPKKQTVKITPSTHRVVVDKAERHERVGGYHESVPHGLEREAERRARPSGVWPGWLRLRIRRGEAGSNRDLGASENS